MEIIKHGNRYFDLHKVYKFVCQNCGCEFNAERHEISAIRIDYEPITEYLAKKYKEKGREGLIECPECGEIAKCVVSLTQDEEEYLDKHTIKRWTNG